MFGSTLTLLNRSLQLDTRLMRSHLMRMLLVLVILFFLYSAQKASLVIGAPGLQFFSSISYMNLLFITLAGISYFATAITEEKEEMTLGLLRMAGVNHLSILLGKSTSRLVNAMLLLAAQFPFTLLAITLGGVSTQQVVAVYVAITAYMIMLSNLALLCSVVSKTSNAASWRTGLAIGLFLGGTPIAQSMLTSAMMRQTINPAGTFATAASACLHWLDQASVFSRLRVIMTTAFKESAFSVQVVSNLVAALVFFALSWLVFETFARDELPASPGRGLLSRRRVAGGLLGCGRAWNNALIWKDFHFMAGGWPMLLGKLILYPVLIGCVVYYATRWSRPGGFDREVLGGTMMVCMLLALLVEPLLLAGRVFREESKWKTLSAIALLPRSLAEIAYLKIAGCLMGLIPAMTWFMFGIMIYPEGFFDAVGEIIDKTGFWFFLVQYIVLLHLTAFLSLIIKWGAAPLAFALIFLVNGFCLFTASPGPGSPEGISIVLIFMGMLGTVVLQFGIGERLRLLAAES